jgi:hypothetical protein
MTKERAEQLGIFTKWETYPCNVCSIYSKFPNLSEYGALIVCNACKKKSEQITASKAQKSLFDEQGVMFMD